MSAMSWMPWYTIPVLVLSLAVPAIFIVKLLRGSAERSRILRQGIPAQATILQIWETGVRVNDSPQVGFRVSVLPPSGVPYETQTVMVVSQLMIPRIQPGSVVRAKLDPANPNNVALEP
jgi:hypothetical protein